MLNIIHENNNLLQLFLILKPLAKDICLVGGCVRDALINKYHNANVSIKDFDIVLNGDLDVISKELLDNGWRVDEAGKNFLVMIVSKNDEQFEIALYRKDGTYSDGRRPDFVNAGDINDDSQRRDFTVNALYYSFADDSFLDPTGKGIDDIKSMTLRFVGRAKDRIKEDKLRIMRAYRFVITKGFTMDDKTHKACRQFFDDMIKETSSMRILNEMDKMI